MARKDLVIYMNIDKDIEKIKLAECQKEFLFNSKYGYDESDNYKTLNYHCAQTNLREKLDVDFLYKEDLPKLKNVFNAISIYCNNCDYRM